MEILASAIVMTTPWWIALLFVFLIASVICMFLSIEEDAIICAIISFVIAIGSAITLIFIPHEVPTDQMKYTVEITDPTKYKELIDSNYEIKKVYENKEIYEIKGDALE